MTNWSGGMCEVNGINMHYTRTGGSKPPVILLHGLMTNGACWTALADAMEKEYDVIMLEAMENRVRPIMGTNTKTMQTMS